MKNSKTSESMQSSDKDCYLKDFAHDDSSSPFAKMFSDETQCPSSNDGQEMSSSGGFSRLNSDEAHQESKTSETNSDEAPGPGGEHPTLEANGPRFSAGSKNHEADGCKPCAFYCFSLSGCKNGDSCKFCHLTHWSQSKAKRDLWDMRANERKGKHPLKLAMAAATATPESGSVSKKQAQAAYHAATPDAYAAIATPELLQAAYTAVPPPLPPLPQGDFLAQIRGIDFMPQQLPAAPLPLPPAAQDAAAAMFEYMPRAAAAAVGQKIELFPMIAGSEPRIYAVAPDLPQGLSIDKFTGIIRGVALQPTAVPSAHFVTACEPLVSFNVKSAVVSISISSMPAPVPGNPGMASGPNWMANAQQIGGNNIDYQALQQLTQMMSMMPMGNGAPAYQYATDNTQRNKPKQNRVR